MLVWQEGEFLSLCWLIETGWKIKKNGWRKKQYEKKSRNLPGDQKEMGWGGERLGENVEDGGERQGQSGRKEKKEVLRWWVHK